MPQVELPKVAKMSTNGEIGLFLDTSPTENEASWEDMREIFENSTHAMNEVILDLAFLNDGGFGSSFVTGAKPTVGLTGRYFKDNTLCGYLSDIEYEIAEKRVTRYKLEKFGKTITGSCTITQLNIGGGGGTDGAPIAMTIAFNGKPTVTNTPISGGT